MEKALREDGLASQSAHPALEATSALVRKMLEQTGRNHIARAWRVTIRSPPTKSCASRTSAGGQFATSSSQWTNSSASTSRASREDLAPASVVAMRLRMEVEKLTPREVLIVERRVLSRPRKTLKEIAAQFGVSTRSGRATHPLPARYMSRRNSIPTGQQEVGDRRRPELRAETFLHPAQTVESPSSALAEPPAEP